MSSSNVLVVVVDGLRAAALGAYGNTIYPTPAFDRFAAESLLLDGCFAPSADLAAIYDGLWQSRHPLRATAAGAASTSLPRFVAERGYVTSLVADDADVLALPGAGAFQRHVAATAADDDSSAIPSLFRTFSSACEAVTAVDAGSSPQLVWLHTKGLYGPWQAPLELQRSLLDEGDPPPVEESQPPDIMLAEDDATEAAFRYGCAYAAQVMLLDDCWNGLMEALRETGRAGDWLVMLLGARGFPLGEHGRMGGVDGRLYIEQLHVPWLIRFPVGRGRLSRRNELVSHLDLMPSLVEWLGGVGQTAFDGRSVEPLVEHVGAKWREVLVSANAGCRSLRTADWTLREDAPDAARNTEAARQELYVRPDDRWEANDVAVRCQEVVAELSHLPNS
jgi:arylsulfatase A-like enzyme